MLIVNGESKVFPVGRVVEVNGGPELKIKKDSSPLQDLRKHLGLLTIRLTVARVLCCLGIASLSYFHTDKCTLVCFSLTCVSQPNLHFIEIWASQPGADSERCAYNTLSEGASVCWISWKMKSNRRKILNFFIIFFYCMD